MTTVARLLRGLLPILAASAATVSAVLPASAAPTASAVSAAGQPTATTASEWWLAAVHASPPRSGQGAGAPAARPPGAGVTVAVLSTGVDAGHPDLTGAVTAGPDFGKTGRAPGSPYWGAEGTAVAALIAGHGHGPGSSQGITGIAPGARILSVPVTLEYDDPLNSDAAITRRLPAAIAAGIRYAADHGASVIALPLDPGTLGPGMSGDPAAAGGSAAERAAVSYALARGAVLVAPAGDNGAEDRSVNYPAGYPGVIAVGATTRDGGLAPFSSTRGYVALTAPGSDTIPDVPGSGATTGGPAAGLTVAAPGGGYASLASSDMSAALTAGVAALIRSRYPRLTVPEVTRALEQGATAPPRPAGQAAAPGWGHGELNAAAALAAAATAAAAHPAPSPSASPSVPSATQQAVAGPGRRPAAPRHDPGHLLRSLVVGLAAAACAAIACLIGALSLIRLRRRRRAATLAGRRPAPGAAPAAPGTPAVSRPRRPSPG